MNPLAPSAPPAGSAAGERQGRRLRQPVRRLSAAPTLRRGRQMRLASVLGPEPHGARGLSQTSVVRHDWYISKIRVWGRHRLGLCAELTSPLPRKRRLPRVSLLQLPLLLLLQRAALAHRPRLTQPGEPRRFRRSAAPRSRARARSALISAVYSRTRPSQETRGGGSS